MVRAARPTPHVLEAARGRTIRDVIAPGLDVLFCGINPGLYSAATGFHFARPGNRFWPALAAAGFTPLKLEPRQWPELLACGVGITNLVARATASADELSDDELRAGRKRLERKVRRYRPRAVAVVGVGAYRIAFDRPAALDRPPARGPRRRAAVDTSEYQRPERALPGRRLHAGVRRTAPCPRNRAMTIVVVLACAHGERASGSVELVLVREY